MKANELRIGNKVYWGVNIVSIVGIHTQTYPNSDNKRPITIYIDPVGNMHYYPIEENNITPIPLTEEWLLKFGFEKDSDGYLIYMKSRIFIEFTTRGHYEISEYDTEIKYVHQLQNLYFALTGNELEIK